jgi:hypothetical protein
MKSRTTALSLLLALSAFALPVLFNNQPAFPAMPVSFGLSAMWLLASVHVLRSTSSRLPLLVTGLPFAVFWPALGLIAELTCRFSNDCL